MNKKKVKKYVFKPLFVLFVIYISLIIAYESGYYETKSQNKAILTQEAMEQFEIDVESGVEVDITEYLEVEQVDYSNQVTKIGNKISNGLTNILVDGLSSMFDTLKTFFW